MRIVIAGAGEVGTHLAKMLANENHEIVLIDPAEVKLRPIDNSLDILTHEGSATSVSLLRDTLIKKTDLFIAVTQSEDTNIISSIMAKRFGAIKTIARIDNLDFLESSILDFFKSIGIDSLIYPELIAAREVLGLLHETGASDFMEFCGGKLAMYVQKLDEDAPIINKSLQEIAMSNRTDKYRAVAIKREGKTIIPRGNEHFQLADSVYVISTNEGMTEMMKTSGKKNFEAKNIMILGGSRIGKHIALHMQKTCEVKLIDSDPKKCEDLAEILDNTLIINGDGRNVDLLEQEGISKMDAFVAVTGNSETNILSCLLAKKFGVKKTFAEVENMEYINLAENSGIDTIINKKISAASRIFRHTVSPIITQVKYMAGTDAEVLELIVPENSRITKGTLRSIDFPKDAIVGGGLRDGIPYIATGDTIINANDKVVVFTLPTAYEKLNKFFT
ncbi:MAG: Trk system potassium transport protein TrkA [Bacteroidetes bacterium GWF2_41_9]|nr:MAG: Trk system potassium transport protein TrkA [Bacteroidetes bacterium GWA2_40_15]OFY59208.1 MAG: Trk system potassium transport protein TrkA [Bacteroidetes bacterium GWF2_41_9]HAM10400.1 Trk system potassium transporter TrkA [Bacteroidales bacterium]HBH82373.1 Trk system potassium transporter TrkA [Bacteroidales bacterium]HBQ82582.1 Trk system potassium transporter TrkA [Bacteroidales bacterium]